MRDIDLQATEDFKLFATRVDTGAPTDVASIAVSAYPDNSTTQITAGITTTQPFDSLTGFGNVRVVATVANGYGYNSTYSLVITTGTVNSISVVGAIVGEFTIGKNRPGLVRMGLCQASASGTCVLDAATSFADDFLNGHFIYISAGTGAGQSRMIDDWVSTTDTATVTPAWTTTPSTDSVFQVICTPPASTGAPSAANVIQWLGTAAATPTVAGVPEVDVTHWIGTAAATPTTAGVPEVDVTFVAGTAAQAASGRFQVDVELIEGADPTDTIRDAVVDDATRIDASALNTASVTTIPAILVDTAEIGAAGAGLTAINLPNQTMDIVGNITGNLSGSVGSVTGAVGSVTGAVGSVTGAVGSVAANGISASSLAADAGTEIAAAVLAAATAAPIDANIQEVNDVAVTGDGESGTEWGPA